MSLKSDRAFLLRSVNYGEADRIVTLFLEQKGKISALAKGARKSMRRFGGALETFSLFEATVTPGKGNLWRLAEARPLVAYNRLAKNLSCMSAAAFLLELTREACPDSEPHPGIFELINSAFTLLETVTTDNKTIFRSKVIVLATELKILREVGIGISISNCNACGKEVPKGRPVRFHPIKGGVVCTPCGGGPITLLAESITALSEMDRFPLTICKDIDISEDALSQIEIAVADFVEHHIGRSITIKTYN